MARLLTDGNGQEKEAQRKTKKQYPISTKLDLTLIFILPLPVTSE